MRSLETPEILTQDRLIIAVGATRFRCAEVLLKTGVSTRTKRDYTFLRTVLLALNVLDVRVSSLLFVSFFTGLPARPLGPLRCTLLVHQHDPMCPTSP